MSDTTTTTTTTTTTKSPLPSSWWAAPLDVDAHVYGLLRLFWGLCALVKTTGAYSPVPRLVRGIFRLDWPLHRYRPSHFAPESLGSTWIPGLPVPSYETYCQLEAGMLAGALLMIVGLGGRLGSVVVAVTGGALLLVDPFGFKHNLFAMVVFAALLSLTPNTRALSLDALLRRLLKRPTSTTVSALPLRFIQLQVVIIYGFSTLAKVNKSWATGHILWESSDGTFERLTRLGVEPLVAIFQHRFWFAGVSIVTVVVEGVMAWCFLRPRLVPWGIWLGVLLHLGIDVCLDVGAYSIIMWASYIAFTNDRPRQHLVEVRGGWQRWGLLALDWLRRLDVRVVDDVAPGMGVRLDTWCALPLPFLLAFPISRWRRRCSASSPSAGGRSAAPT